MSRSPSSSSSCESNHTFSDESETESLSETSIEIAGYDDSIEPVPTEEVSQYLQQLALEEEEELSRFFRGGRHCELVCTHALVRVKKYRIFHHTIYKNFNIIRS